MADTKPWFVPEEPAEDRVCGTRKREVYVIVDSRSPSGPMRPRWTPISIIWWLAVAIALFLFLVHLATLFVKWLIPTVS